MSHPNRHDWTSQDGWITFADPPGNFRTDAEWQPTGVGNEELAGFGYAGQDEFLVRMRTTVQINHFT